MAYATLNDVSAILPDDEEIDDAEQERLLVNLDEATDLVISYLELEYEGDDEDDDGVPDDVPPAVRRVVARVALRIFMADPINPGAEGEVSQMGPFSHTVNWSKEAQARDGFLTDADKLRLDRFKVGYTGKATAIPMAGVGGTDWYAC